MDQIVAITERRQRKSFKRRELQADITTILRGCFGAGVGVTVAHSH